MPFSAKTVRILRRALLGLAGFATLVAVAWLVENVRGQRAWESTFKTYARRGDPLDVLPVSPPIPADQNFMQTPLMARLALAHFTSPELAAFREEYPLHFFVPTQRNPWDAGQPLQTQLRAYRATLDVQNRRTANVPVNAPQTLHSL